MFHGGEVYFTDQKLFEGRGGDMVQDTLKNLFRRFIHQYDKEGVRVYQKQLFSNATESKHYITVNLQDMKNFDEQLYEKFMADPLGGLSLIEEATTQYAQEHGKDHDEKDKWQVMLNTEANPRRLRQVTSGMVSKIFSIQGIIVTTSKPFLKATILKVQCKSCGHIKDIPLGPGQSPYIPRKCVASTNQNKCQLDSYIVLPTSDVIDSQNIKIQELPQQIPTGQTPRASLLYADRANVQKCVPGDKVKITGVMQVQNFKSNSDNLSSSYIYVTGIQKLSQRNYVSYSVQEEDNFKKLAKDPKIYQKICQSIAPGIYGSEEIKKAIACLLFGGSRKNLTDNTKLRGDINLLLIGDPSTAKSQFLKFVEQAASIGIYTSGKGSSAAGLTATITKDISSGQFQIQGGALVLADGGIVCIDQFDKMRPADRVAIHEAMEQQTISVAKAGITTRLNSRTSVLAAANPIFGKIDDTKHIGQQIELQTTILSRFDCIFIVKDINTPQNNARIATYILESSLGKAGVIKKQSVHQDLPFETLKKYIAYARSKCAPKLSSEASEKLQNLYVSDRQKSKEQRAVTKNSIPITVRQLEAVIRLSQSLAKMKLKDEVTSEHVDQAHRLFQISTMKSIQAKQMGLQNISLLGSDIIKAEDAIKKRVCIGNQVSISRIFEQIDRFSRSVLQQAVNNLVRNGDFREVKGKSHLIREH